MNSRPRARSPGTALLPRADALRSETLPRWYRCLRFACIWACLSFITANAAFLLTQLAQAAPLPPAAVPCEDDGWRSVRGGQECLVVHVRGRPGVDGRTVLLVFVHGDHSSGGPSGPTPRRDAALATPGTVVASLIRPGYHDRDGRHSTGTSHRYTGDGYPPRVVDAVGGAIARLRHLHGAQRVVVAGLSGGSAITGVLLGRAPGLIDMAVLSGCPCDVRHWRQLRGSGNWRRSLSPHQFVHQVPSRTRVRLVAGEEDTNTPPVLAQAYVQALQARGIDARFLLAPGADHAQAGRGHVFLQAVERAVTRMHEELQALPKTRS